MKKLNMVSLYTGAGGLDYGFEEAGFKTSVAVENDFDCVETIKKNREWPTIDKDISNVTSKEILEKGNLEKDDIDLLIGGPPCQPFSKAAYWVNGDTKRLEDSRADTLFEYMRCVEDFLPTSFFLENVHGINYSGKEEGFKKLKELTEKINKKHGTHYIPCWRVLNSADYGVPQLRKRFFLVAHREGRLFEFPPETHSKLSSDNGSQVNLDSIELSPYVTSWGAIGDLKEPKNENLDVRGKWADLLPSIPEGENYLWHTNRKGGLQLFGWRTRYWSFLLKLAKNLPSWTISAQPGPAIGPFHWKNRRLSVKEMARIQTFPEDIVFYGGRNSVQKQIGNAVPSLMAEVLAREITTQFFDAKVPKHPMFAIKLNRPIPNPKPTKPVPKKYHEYIGDHPDHP